VLQPKEKEKQFKLHKQQLLNHFFFFRQLKKSTNKSASFIIRVGRVKARAHSNWHKAVVVLCQLDWQSY